MYKLGQYCPSVTSVHRIDPRIKILAVVVLSIVILQAKPLALAAFAGLIVGITWMSHIRLRFLLQNMRPVLSFFAGLFLIYAFFTPGNPLPGFPIGPIQITYAGVEVGALQVGKFLLLVLAAALLTMTTTPTELTMGMERLLRPVNLVGASSHNIATMLSLALRFLPLLEEELNTLKEAQLTRGVDYNDGAVRGKIRAVSYLAAPLAVNMFRRCDNIIDAMEARGYQPGNRTYLHDLRLRRADYCLLMLLGAAVVIQLALYVS